MSMALFLIALCLEQLFIIIILFYTFLKLKILKTEMIQVSSPSSLFAKKKKKNIF